MVTITQLYDRSASPPTRYPAGHLLIFGARLVRLTNLLREHKLAIVRPLSGRYSNLEPIQPWVAEIVIRRLDKSGGAPG